MVARVPWLCWGQSSGAFRVRGLRVEGGLQVLGFRVQGWGLRVLANSCEFRGSFGCLAYVSVGMAPWP